MLLHFKDGANEEECPLPDDVREELVKFHQDLLAHCGMQSPAAPCSALS